MWTASLLSWWSQWIQHAALGWAVYEITGSGTLLGAVMGARAIPMVLLTPVSGMAADRYDRRRLMQASQGVAAAVSLAFGAALALEIISTWMLFAFTVAMGASNVMDRPARFTTAFELVPREIAVKAVALNTIGFSLARVLGPAVAGYMIAAVGGAGSFFLQGILYAASGFMVLLVAFPKRAHPPAQRSAFADMLEGLRFAASSPRTRVLLAVGLLPFFLLIPVFGTLYPIYAKDEFGVGPAGLGLLLTAAARMMEALRTPAASESGPATSAPSEMKAGFSMRSAEMRPRIASGAPICTMAMLLEACAISAAPPTTLNTSASANDELNATPMIDAAMTTTHTD